MERPYRHPYRKTVEMMGVDFCLRKRSHIEPAAKEDNCVIESMWLDMGTKSTASPPSFVCVCTRNVEKLNVIVAASEWQVEGRQQPRISFIDPRCLSHPFKTG